VVVDVGRPQLDPQLVAHGYVHPHLPQEGQGGGDVLEMGDVADAQGLGGEQAGAEDGEGGVLRAGDADFPVQGNPAVDDQLIH